MLFKFDELKRMMPKGPSWIPGLTWEDFAAKWSQIEGGKWRSEGGRVLSNEVYQRMQANQKKPQPKETPKRAPQAQQPQAQPKPPVVENPDRAKLESDKAMFEQIQKRTLSDIQKLERSKASPKLLGELKVRAGELQGKIESIQAKIGGPKLLVKKAKIENKKTSAINTVKTLPVPKQEAKPPKIPDAQNSDRISAEHYSKVASSLTREQRNAIEEYTHDETQEVGFKDINTNLWQDKPLTPRQQKTVGILNAAMKQAGDFPEPITVHRGVNFKDQQSLNNFIQSLDKGNEIEMKGFSSTSLDPKVAEEYDKNNKEVKYPVFLQIVAKRGLRVEKLSLFPSEKEVILPQSTRFKKIGKEVKNGKTTYILEQI